MTEAADDLTSLYIRIYFDEDVSHRVVKNLRTRGFDVLSTPEAGMLASSDEEQIAYAVAQRRAIFTYNLVHFEQIHRRFIEGGDDHYGIIVAKRRANDELVVRKLLNLLNEVSGDEMRNQLRYL
jgi:acetolactate synthase regulatory subunit